MKIKINKKLNIGKIQLGADKTSWEKAYYWAFVTTIILFIASCGLIAIKPVTDETKEVIDSEIESTDIRFNQITLDKIKERLELPPLSKPSTGKNPFSF